MKSHLEHGPGSMEWDVMKMDLQKKTLDDWLSKSQNHMDFFEQLSDDEQVAFERLDYKQKQDYYLEWMKQHDKTNYPKRRKPLA